MPLERLRRCVDDLTALIDAAPPEARVRDAGAALLQRLIAVDDWLPDDHARPSPERYQQYLLYADPRQRFSVVSFVWGPGQATPVHDHTVWGLIGVLRGAECSLPYRYDPAAGLVPTGPEERLERGAVAAVSPAIGDIHRVRNAFDDRVSISIHIYGADIGTVRRAVYAPHTPPRDFISAYANDTPLVNA
ncbi:cysteine dioxygenase [Robbsia sp. Bb-Pol-6]|uniref:Cysteine dioxygenase n=1 Tax=Robbsia betulipollinis TaxID=2981849 RepID=A0ABT3ZLI3_9BURK|nr:cysteine dioxygenase [Robbsia betulipollinis]MCY0387403.1 cysteine dioxygenase [Robbsia betulipollinis]